MFAAAGGPSPQHPYVVVAAAETLHVEAWPGDGRPVAVDPGLFGGAFTSRKVVPLLAALGYRPIVIEPLGTGFSSRPAKADYSLAAQANRLAAVLDSLNAGPVLVLAHSLGGSMTIGTGFSSRPAKADYSLAAQANRLAAVLDSLNAGHVLVLAHSLGAAIAFRLARL